MFTGIVEETGVIESIVRHASGAVAWIRTQRIAQELQLGESMATSGVCLTVVETRGPLFRADLAPETLDRTTLSHLKEGSPVNLERPLRLSDRLGGHLVAGHVDGVGRVTGVEETGDGRILNLEVPEALRKYIVYKGSIAVDGVSLTVAKVTPTGFSVAIIPHTAKVTTLGRVQPGDSINLETDLMGKYVERLVEAYLLNSVRRSD